MHLYNIMLSELLTAGGSTGVDDSGDGNIPNCAIYHPRGCSGTWLLFTYPLTIGRP